MIDSLMLAMQDAAKPAAPVARELNLVGGVFMVISVAFVTILMICCFRLVLGLPEEPKDIEKFHSA